MLLALLEDRALHCRGGREALGHLRRASRAARAACSLATAGVDLGRVLRRRRRGRPSTGPRSALGSLNSASPAGAGERLVEVLHGSRCLMRLGLLGGDAALLGELLARRASRTVGCLRIELVHQRLGEARLVALVVAVAAVADEVDDDVALERLAVLGGQPHHVDAGLRVVAVHVEDGDVQHLRDGGAVDASERASSRVGGEADLVVDDDVDGAAGVVAARAARG